MGLQDDNVALVFGLLGTAVSSLVYLAPVPTFYRIIRSRSTEGFQSIPYIVALYSAMLTLYYATTMGDNSPILKIINSIGCFLESIYIILYLIYAPSSSRIYTGKLILLFNGLSFSLIVLFTTLFVHGQRRMAVVGWICAAFSVCVFAAPLGIIRQVIKTRSVEYMPFLLSFFLTLSGAFWLVYGLSIGNYFIAAPNFLGLALGFSQMLLYFIYRNKRNEVGPESQPHQPYHPSNQIIATHRPAEKIDGISILVVAI